MALDMEAVRAQMGEGTERQDGVQYPAHFVLVRWDRYEERVVGFVVRSGTIRNDADLDAELVMYRNLEDAGGHVYEYTLAEVDRADQVLAERVAWMEFERGLRDSPYEEEPERGLRDSPYLDDDEEEPESEWERAVVQAEGLARAHFGGDEAVLQRMPAAVELARAQAWTLAGDAQNTFEMAGSEGRAYSVNGRCTCPDYEYRGEWCKHRLARALALKARILMEDGSGDAATSPDREPSGTEDTTTQDPTTDFDLSQVKNFLPRWGANPGVHVFYETRDVLLDEPHYNDLAREAEARGWAKAPAAWEFLYMNPAYA